MVKNDNIPDVIFLDKFKKKFQKLEGSMKTRVKKQIYKIILNPTIGKPMRFTLKGTREVYIDSYRLSYRYIGQKNLIEFAELYHKDDQ